MTDHNPSPTAPVTAGSFMTRAAGFVADALKYWEPRRIIYNLALAAVVVGHVVADWPKSRDALTLNVLLMFFFLAVLANVCYSVVYVIDLFVQFSGMDEFWAKGRIALLIIGTAFAAVIAHFFLTGIMVGV
jgi:hypothetical protein